MRHVGIRSSNKFSSRGATQGASEPQQVQAQAQAQLSTQAFEPMNREELEFIWHLLAESGHVTVERLKGFMQEVAGVKLSTVQAKDLLNYMDADGNDSVGQEDFRYFMSTGYLDSTDVETLMWHPKAKYLESHAHFHEEPSDTNRTLLGGADRRGSSKDRGPQYHSGGSYASSHFAPPLENDESDASGDSVPGAMPNLPGPPGSARPAFMRKATQSGLREREKRGSEGQAASSVKRNSKSMSQGAASMPVDSLSARDTARRSITIKPPEDQRRHSLATSATRSSTKSKSDREPSKERRRPTRRLTISQKQIDRIESIVKKYEAETWQDLLTTEEDFKRELFNKFASKDGEMTPHDYHKLLAHWHEVASWKGGVLPGDTLSCLEYILARESFRERGLTHAAPIVPVMGEMPADGGVKGVEGGEPPQPTQTHEVKLSYTVWSHVCNGKHRPDEHLAHKAHSR